MPRQILEESRIHSAIRDVVANNHRDLLDEVIRAVGQHDVVVVGMAQNPAPKKARKLLTAAGLPHHYLEYGSYFNNWRRRNVLKMWSGWPTFPMVFVKGTLIGGADDLAKLMESGALKTLLGK